MQVIRRMNVAPESTSFARLFMVGGATVGQMVERKSPSLAADLFCCELVLSGPHSGSRDPSPQYLKSSLHFSMATCRPWSPPARSFRSVTPVLPD